MEFIKDSFLNICNLMPKELVFDRKYHFINLKGSFWRHIKIPRFGEKKFLYKVPIKSMLNTKHLFLSLNITI